MAHFQQAEENIVSVQQAEENIITPVSEELPTPAGSEMVTAQGIFGDIGNMLDRAADAVIAPVKQIGETVIDGVNKGVEVVEGGAKEVIGVIGGPLGN